MIHTITSHRLAIFLLLGSVIVNIALADETVGKIILDENSVYVEGVSVHSHIDKDGKNSNISQSISVENIVNRSNTGVSSVQIGAVNMNNEISCEQLEGRGGLLGTIKIMGNGRDMRLDNKISSTVCIKGSLNRILISEKTRMGKLFLDGSDNEIFITNAESVKHIDIVGEENSLTLPNEHNIVIKGLDGSNKVNFP